LTGFIIQAQSPISEVGWAGFLGEKAAKSSAAEFSNFSGSLRLPAFRCGEFLCSFRGNVGKLRPGWGFLAHKDVAMAWGKEAAGWWVSLALLVSGCTGPVVSRGQLPEARPVPPPADRQRGPELRIAAPDTAAPAPRPDPLRTLYQQAAGEYAGLSSYIVRLRRREQVGGKDKPEEVLLFKFRKQPFSVYFKWLGQERKGREVVYVQGRHGNQLHTRLAAGDVLLMTAGRRISLAPDNPLVLASSRHPITDAGVGSLLAHLDQLLQATERGDGRMGTLRYLGPIRRPEFETPCEAAEETIPPGCDPHLPQGGRRLWVFDPLRHLPSLVITSDATGHEVEYYCFDRWQYPVQLDDDDFNPDKLWPSR
jgi:hypothetical protein